MVHLSTPAVVLVGEAIDTTPMGRAHGDDSTHLYSGMKWTRPLLACRYMSHISPRSMMPKSSNGKYLFEASSTRECDAFSYPLNLLKLSSPAHCQDTGRPSPNTSVHRVSQTIRTIDAFAGRLSQLSTRFLQRADWGKHTIRSQPRVLASQFQRQNLFSVVDLMQDSDLLPIRRRQNVNVVHDHLSFYVMT